MSPEMPPQLYLTRCDPARNMARYYALEVAPDLLGGAVLIRSWGRIGARGQQRRQWYAAAAEAVGAQSHWLDRKQRRGYRPPE